MTNLHVVTADDPWIPLPPSGLNIRSTSQRASWSPPGDPRVCLTSSTTTSTRDRPLSLPFLGFTSGGPAAFEPVTFVSYRPRLTRRDETPPDPPARPTHGVPARSG